MRQNKGDHVSEDESSGGGGNVFQRIASLLLINRFRGDSGIGFNRAATWVAMSVYRPINSTFPNRSIRASRNRLR